MSARLKMTTETPALVKTLELCSEDNDFVRHAKWSMDGSAFLAQCESQTYQIVKDDDVSSKRVITAASPILDCLWYPTASAREPASYCFVSSVREQPVQLLDATDGRLRASYSIIDHRERQVAPHSLAFNPFATKLYCGFEDAIEVFDVSSPGVEGTRLAITSSKKSKDGLKAFYPSWSGDDIFAAGSLMPTDGNIALFSTATGATPQMFAEGGPRSAVTQLMFHPTEPHLLYASFRSHNSVYCWDIRSHTDAPVRLLNYGAANERAGNQKRKFDIQGSGRWLGIGDERGNINMFDITQGSEQEKPPELVFRAHNDVVGSVSLHPRAPQILSVSGSRHFPYDGDDHSNSEEAEGEEEQPVIRKRTRPPRPLDATVKIWESSHCLRDNAMNA